MKWSAFEVRFFQLLKPTIECDKLQYKYTGIIVHQAFRLELLNAHPHMISTWRYYILVIPCAPVVCLI